MALLDLIGIPTVCAVNVVMETPTLLLLVWGNPTQANRSMRAVMVI